MAPRKSANERKVVTYRPFSKITNHIDPMVLYTFLSLLVISIVLLSFQAGSREDCSQASITLTGKQHAGKNASYNTGEVITFKASLPDGRRSGLTWNFGDSSQQAQGLQVYHAFNKAGSYMITLSAGKCSWRQEVIVLNALPENTPAPVADIYPVIDGPSEVFAGRLVTFSNNTPNASSWQWQLIQSGANIYTKKSVSYTFGEPGERVLSLIVNGDTSRMVTKRIQVFPAPAGNRSNDRFEPMPFPEQAPADPAAGAPLTALEKPKTPAISDDEFKYMLSQVVDKQKNAGDFSAYLCNDMNARVLINDKENDSFTHFCSRIRGKKRLKIEMVNLIKDQNGCVKEIRVRYDKKGFLGIF